MTYGTGMKGKTAACSAVAGLALFCVAGCGPSYPSCDEDGDCHTGEFCVNGQCQLCRTSADCPSGAECQGGRCEDVPGYCTSTTDCPAGQECRNNRCIAPVTSNTDIPDPNDGNTDGACQIQPVYFAFDADSLESDTRSTIEANARCLRQRGVNRVHLTGYTDPRGTEEYNLALGDRRARSVGQFLTSLGIESGAMTTSSMGEEMSNGEDEDGWRRDRRVEFSTQ
jgi:peptidoglycan-associated lipoprotein